jgi:hypothetical protein
MDQVKEFIRQCIKYRFWISLGAAALFALIAYFLGSRPVQAKAEAETKAITQAHTDVKQFSGSGVPTPAYKPIVDEKTGDLTNDVNGAWRQVYNRQAPLLTWPTIVEKQFRQWGRKWPETVAESAVQFTIVDYVHAYPEYVETVYKCFNPFDYVSGKGIVSAPPKELLLRPVAFDDIKLPELGKVWAAQERLWLQRTALEVVARVNKNAKDWDSAIIKQINLLEVGNHMAQDARSIANGETLEEPEAISAPGTEKTEDAAAPAATSQMASMMRGKMGSMESASAGGFSGGSSGGFAGGSGGAPESIFYVKSESGKDQYKILPLLLSVLIDEDHIQDLLVELANSPMSIQVMDLELGKSPSRITKPEKGAGANFAGYGEAMMGGMMRSMGGRMGMMGMGGYGGMAASYSSMMSRMMMGGKGGMGEMMMRGMQGAGGMGGAPERKGTDKRATDRGKTRKEEIKTAESAKGLSLFDPHYNIIEVKVFGQARFYNTPPPEPATEASPGQTSADASKSEESAKTGEPAKSPQPAARTSEPAKTESAKAAEPAKEAPQPGAPKS